MYNNVIKQRVLMARLAEKMRKASEYKDSGVIKTENGYAEVDENGKVIFEMKFEEAK